MEKATLYDLDRMCKSYSGCTNCPFEPENTPPADCRIFIFKNIDKANKIIIDWCKKHPVKTRKDVFLEHYPNATVKATRPGTINICPTYIDKTYSVCCSDDDCNDCMEKYWTAEAD